MVEPFTVVGAEGFIGGALAARLEQQGHAVQRWNRANPPEPKASLGHVIFAAGVTADFRRRALDTVEAHVSLCAQLLFRYRYDSFTYLSSARLYRHAQGSSEAARFEIDPANPEHFYDLTKLTGEALCLNRPEASVRVVRLSNVMGVDGASHNFLPALIRDALTRGAVQLHCAPDSGKDYVLLEDVIALLPQIALEGRERIYNLASGEVTKADFIVKTLKEVTGCEVSYAQNAPLLLQPAIDISRVKSEFGFAPRPLAPELKGLIHAYEVALPGRSDD